MITAERYHDISCGHRVHGHESKCAHLHGHNYRIHFKVIAEAVFIGSSVAVDLDHLGRVIDFSVIKSKLCMWLENFWDHKFLIWERDPWADHLFQLDRKGVVFTPFNPTAENIGLHLLNVVGPKELKDTGVTLIEVRVEETRKCSATARRM